MDAFRKRPFLILSVLLAVLPGCAPTASPAGGGTPLQPTNTAKPTAALTATPQPTAGPVWATRLIDVGAGDHDGRLYGEDPANLYYGIPDALGVTVAAGGDFNGDGFMDALVGAYGADGPQNLREHAGEVYVIFGSSDLNSPWDVVGVAGGKPDIRIYGEETGVGSSMFAPGDSLGEVLTVGDVDGDGYDDLLLTSPVADGPQNARINTGEVYIYFGRSPEDWEKLRVADGEPIVLDVAGAAGPGPSVTIYGQDEEDVLGCSLSAGDADGDGKDDLLAGACYADGPLNDRPSAGAAYLFLGRSREDWEKDHIIDLAVFPQKADVTFDGADPDDRLGSASAGGGDVDADGVEDLLIGAPKADGPGNGAPDAGEVFLFFGRSADDWHSLNPVDLAMNPADAVLNGADAGDNLGGFLGLWMADVDGDGTADLIIGSPYGGGAGNGKTAAGEVYLMLGRRQWNAATDFGSASADVVLYGADQGDSFGYSVGAGDVNGDGIRDILIGAFGADGPGNKRSDASGEAYAVFGRAFSAGMVIDANVPDALQVLVYGEETGDNLGYMVSGGDVNGDGVDDMLIGAMSADGPNNGRPDAGEAYIVYGQK
jgi:hypothetical protein